MKLTLLVLLLLSIHTPTSAAPGDAEAHWVSRDTIAWKVAGATTNRYQLHAGESEIGLVYDPMGLDRGVLERFPHLAGYTALRIPAAAVDRVPELLRGSLTVAASDASGAWLGGAALQIPGVLDELYPYRGELGAILDGAETRLTLWAPTARSVRLLLFADARPATEPTPVAMTFDAATGVWTARGPRAWRGRFYQYEVEVYAPATGRVERNRVTDPYSTSLSTNSARSQIVDLADPRLAPPGWSRLVKPPLDAPEDAVVYELHLRDFSISDQTVPAAHRGTYLAFTHSNSNGMKHLRALARAGLTHVHLLPVFDIGSVDEDRRARREPDPAVLAAAPADSPKQQEAIEPIRDLDGFNWGYDPFHFTVPEGSYATDPDGTARIVEFRRMVQALNRDGLRVVMDVVYNHTFRGGQDPKSVLDRIVPGYYHRLNGAGQIETSTCCANTASEHAMMERLMVDSIVTWAKHYKVDGFRFDLMGHHMASNMQKVRGALDRLTVAKDGVDGSRILVYGEGWNFGEVADNARGVNATQRNLAGTGIGTFNDRLRDAVRGGRPFAGYQEQGFASGLFYDPNGTEQGTPDEQRAKLNHVTDWIRVGMAGNLAGYRLVDSAGRTVTGAEVDYYGQPTGYTRDPQENVVYAEAHDNETFFDATAVKAPASSVADRVRMQQIAIDVVALSQGVPFFHAGQDMLRSKSMDRDSFNSGDWFNRLDFTYRSNNWGTGLPPAWTTKERWPLVGPLLADPKMRPSPDEIASTVEHFREMLRIRKSSRLFRLRTADEIASKVRFLNTGPDQIPGLVVVAIDNRGAGRVADPFDLVVALVNASAREQAFEARELAGAGLALHPVLAASRDPLSRTSRFDPATGSFRVPARTTAVFVARAR